MVSGKWGGLNILIRWIFPSDWFLLINRYIHRAIVSSSAKPQFCLTLESVKGNVWKRYNKQSSLVRITALSSVLSHLHSGLHLFLLLLIFLADLLTTIVGGRVLLTDIVTIFCIQSVPTNKFRFKAFPSISHKKGSKCLKPIFFRITTMTVILRCSEVLWLHIPSKRPVPSSTRNCSSFNYSCQKMTEQAFAWFWPQRPLRPAPFTDYQLSGHRSSPIQSHQGSSATVFLLWIIILIRIPCSPFPLSHFLFSTGRGRPQTSGETIQSTKSLNSLHRTQIGSPENSNNEVKRIEFLLFSEVTWI